MNFSVLPSIECHPSCTDGIMYCTGEGADECCGFYEDNVCVAECPEELTNDTDFNCGERLIKYGTADLVTDKCQCACAMLFTYTRRRPNGVASGKG